MVRNRRTRQAVPVSQAVPENEPDHWQDAPGPCTVSDLLPDHTQPGCQGPVEVEVETDRDEISLALGSELQVAPLEACAAL